MTMIQSILEIANRMEKSAESEERQGRYDVEAVLRGYVTELRKVTVVGNLSADAAAAIKKDKRGGKERTSAHDLHTDKGVKE